MLACGHVFVIALLHVSVLALEFTLPLQQRPFGMPIFFFVEGVAVDFGEEIEPVDVGGECLVFYVCIKADEGHELSLQLVEEAKRDASDVGIEGVLVEEVVQILGGYYIGGQQDTMHILGVEDEARVVLQKAVDEYQCVDVSAGRAVHILEHSCMGHVLLAR